MFRSQRIALPRRQRGAVAVLAAGAIVAMLTLVMVAVEVGRMYSAHRQLEGLAAIAAMDAVQVVGGCDRVSAPTVDEVNDGVRLSLLRQGGDPDVLMGTGSEVQVGEMDTFDGIRRLVPTATDRASAVGVTLTLPFPAPLLGFVPASSQSMVVRAQATQDVVGRVGIGSTMLTFDTAEAELLNTWVTALLGGPVTLSAVSYQGLLDADITLKELALAAGVASPGDLLSLSMTAPEALQLVADAVGAGGEAGEAGAIAVLNELAAIVDPSRNSILLGDILSIEEGAEDLVGLLPVNTLELMLALSEGAAAGYPLSVPLSVSIPGISTVALTARIGQARQIAFGRPGFLEDGTARTQAHTSQIMMQLDATVLDSAALLGVGGALLEFSVVAEVAPATATLRLVNCAYSGLPHHEATVDVETGVASVAIGKYNSLHAANPMLQGLGQILNVPGLLRISVNDPITIEVAEYEGDEVFEGPFQPTAENMDPTTHVRSAGAGVDDTLNGLTEEFADGMVQEVQFSGLLGGPLTLLSDAATALLLNSLLSPLWDLLDIVMGDLLGALGIELGTATVTVDSLKARQPELFNRDPAGT